MSVDFGQQTAPPAEAVTFAALDQPLQAAPVQLDLVGRVRTLISDTGDTRIFSDAELTELLLDVVADFSSYVPHVKEQELELVAGTRVYTLVDQVGVGETPGDILAVESVTWPTTATAPTSHLDPYNPLLLPNPLLVPNWEHELVAGEHRLTITPTPAAATTVTVRYHLVHVPNQDGVYVTVPKRYETVLLELLRARCLEVIGTDQAMYQRWRDGMTSASYDQADELLKAARRARRQALKRLTN